MSKAFDDIKQGLKQAIAYENGELSDVKITIMSDQEYIESIPGLKEKILEAEKIPASECIPESEIDWDEPTNEKKWRDISADNKWQINEDGEARCPYCKIYAMEDEYTGKPILFKYCPECGKFLNGPGQHTAPSNCGSIEKYTLVSDSLVGALKQDYNYDEDIEKKRNVFLEKVVDEMLLEEAESRMAETETEGFISFDEVMASLGIAEKDLEDCEGVELDMGVPIKKNFLSKSEFCIGDNDLEIIKGYVLGALKRIEVYSKELSLTNEQKIEILHALELSGEDLTTQEAFDYYIKNS